MGYDLEKKLIDLHYDIALKVYGFLFEKNEISNIVSEKTKIIYGIVGSNAGDIYYDKSYAKAHYGTTKLLKIWGVAIEAKNIMG